MTMPKIIRNLDAAREHLRNRQSFQTRARRTNYGDFVSLSGHDGQGGWPVVSLGREHDAYGKPIPDGDIETRTLGWGFLPRDYHDSLHLADYVVYSYDTPIAWHHDRPHDLTQPELVSAWLSDSGDGVWIMPEVKYTVTTTQHQQDVRGHLAGYGRPWAGVPEREVLPLVHFTLPDAPTKVTGISVERTIY